MSYEFGLGAGLRALIAARMGMQVTGNNVANVNTPGYSRQRVDLAAAMPYTLGDGLQIGSGVDVTGIGRLVDDGLERRISMQLGMVGAAEVDQSHWQELQSIFNEPDGGLSSSMSDFFGSISHLQSSPSDRALRGGVVSSAATMAQGLNLMATRFADLGDSTFTQVRGLVQQVNQEASAISQLNTQILSLQSNGNPANDLLDQREAHVKNLAKLIDTRALPRASGSLDILVGGHLLVSGGRASPLAVTKTALGRTEVFAGSPSAPVQLHDGQISALIAQEGAGIPELTARLDGFTRNLILETNRVQSTGMPATGPFSALTSFEVADDNNHNGTRGDELLSQAGFPFPVRQGDLYVTVTNRTTGAIDRHRIAIDPSAMSVRDVASAIDNLDHVSASIDPTGRLRMTAEAGYGFDFSPRVDPSPNGQGTFGGTAPSAGTAGAGPFDLSGQTFPVTFSVTTGTATAPVVTNVTLQATDFANPGAATADELARTINNQLSGAGTAVNVGGRLLIRSSSGGATSQLQLANVGTGTALQALGLPTTVSQGQATAVAVHVEGSYTGANNGQLTFVPSGNGQIGVTPGLQVAVYDQSGTLVSRLDVGPGYTPGTLLDLGNGLHASFGAGAVSGSANQALSFDVLADSDTSDFLVATGMNCLFHGSTTADISVDPDLSANPDLLAAGLTPAAGDGGNLQRLMGLRDSKLSSLGNNTLEDYVTTMVGDLGFSASGADQVLQGQNDLLNHLQQQRESISGVNLDEEMVDMMSWQNSFTAASRFLSVVQDMTNTLMTLGQ
jgi:flagellar hook-associated protein FlgK